MKVLYLDCAMGAAGDMLTAALLELHPSPETFLRRVNGLGIEGIEIEAQKTEKCGITGTHIEVSFHGRAEGCESDEHHGHCHHHMTIAEIFDVLGEIELSDKVKNDVKGVFSILAQAESRVHNTSVDNIHFHELGTMDAVADIICVCMLMEELSPNAVYASSVNVGGGYVKCAHGLLPVPAPATAEILKGIPVYSGEIKSELCTPTGAALLKYFVSEFRDMPEMTAERIGYGMGKKDFSVPNCVRAFYGEARDKEENVCVLSCNLDDMTGEELSFASDRLFDAGALDVYTVPVYMKKSRPGIILQCICRMDTKEQIVRAIFKYTSTLGIREELCRRYELRREVIPCDTEYGRIRIKRAAGWGVSREKPEYDDMSSAAAAHGVTMEEIRKSL